MRYLLLIYSGHGSAQAGSEVEQGDVLVQELFVAAELPRRGMRESGGTLEPAHTATTVRIHGSGTLVDDGPFSELPQDLVGYCVLNCKNLDEALEFAGKLPAREGAVEIRPIREMRIPPQVGG